MTVAENHQQDPALSEQVTCRRCGVPMVPEETYFEYLDHGFHTKLLRCPKCKEVYIPESLATGKMAEVEQNLEDK